MMTFDLVELPGGWFEPSGSAPVSVPPISSIGRTALAGAILAIGRIVSDTPTGGFAKLYGQKIMNSSLMECSVATRWAFMVIVSLADENGFFRCATVGGLARTANISHAQAKKAIEELSSPDPDSTTEEEEGRRILPRSGGFYVVTHKMHRDFRSKHQARSAENQRQYRERLRAGAETTTDNALSALPAVTTEGEGEGEAEPKKKVKKRGSDEPPPAPLTGLVRWDKKDRKVRFEDGGEERLRDELEKIREGEGIKATLTQKEMQEGWGRLNGHLIGNPFKTNKKTLPSIVLNWFETDMRRKDNNPGWGKGIAQRIEEQARERMGPHGNDRIGQGDSDSDIKRLTVRSFRRND